MREPPSGKQYEITSGAQRATVVEVGAGLREYSVGDRPVLDGFTTHERAEGGRGQPLLPWPNRIVDGQYEFDGQSFQLPIDEVPLHNAIHGLTRWQNWSPLEQAHDRVRLGLTLHSRPGYPFLLELEIDYSLDAGGLKVRTTARNRGDRRLPFGAGQHPYFTVGTPRVDQATLQFAAASRLEVDSERLVPTGAQPRTAGSSFDFRVARKIGDQVLDDCFTELERDVHGAAHVTLNDPSTGRFVALWMSSQYQYVQVFTGDTLTPDKRRIGLALEPMTCPPNAFRTGIGLIVLHPDEALSLEWGITTT
jgi:aldose 1-epimerase